MKFIATLLLSFMVISLLSVPTNAAPVELKQQVLPLDCVFQVVNDGTGSVIYLTPSECGQIVTPPETPPQTPPPFNSPLTTPPAAPIVITIINDGSGISQIPFIPVANTQASRLQRVLGSLNNIPYTPYTTITQTQEVQSVVDPTIDSPASTIPSIILWMVILTLLLILLLYVV